MDNGHTFAENAVLLGTVTLLVVLVIFLFPDEINRGLHIAERFVRDLLAR